MNHEQRLEQLDCDPICARLVAEDYIREENTAYLEKCIEYTEAVKKSISDHVLEVIG